MNWEKIKNFVFGGAGAVGFVLLMGFIDWRVGVKVDAALAAQDLGTDAKIVEMDKATALNTAGVKDNREDIEDNERRVEQAFAVLLGREVDDN